MSWKILRVLTTNACNYNCFYCHNEGQNDKRTITEMKFEDFLIVAKKLFDTSITEIRFSGGEPLLNADTIRMVEWASEFTNLEVGIATNGSLITKDLAARIANTRALMTVHLPSTDNEHYKQVTGFSYMDALHGLEFLDYYNVNYSLNYVAHEKTLDNMENVIQFAVKNRCQLKVLPYINKNVKKFADLKSFIAERLQKYTYSFEYDDVCGINWWFLPNGARIKLISTPCMDNNIGLCKEYAELRLLPDMRLQRCIFDEPVIIKNIDSFTREINMLWNEFYHCPLGRIT